jgi:hypothetical protein
MRQPILIAVQGPETDAPVPVAPTEAQVAFMRGICVGMMEGGVLGRRLWPKMGICDRPRSSGARVHSSRPSCAPGSEQLSLPLRYLYEIVGHWGAFRARAEGRTKRG